MLPRQLSSPGTNFSTPIKLSNTVVDDIYNALPAYIEDNIP